MLFVILPIFIALYAFAPIFLAVILGIFMLIGIFTSVNKSAKSFKALNF